MDWEKHQNDLIGEVIEEWAADAPERVAVKWVEQDRCEERTYRQLYEDIRACAEEYLKGYRNRRIAICGKQDYRFLVLLLAILSSRNSAVIVNDFMENRENRELLESIRTAVFISYDGEKFCVKEEERDAESPDDEGGKGNRSEAVVLLTSGTTGRKKCVSLSHRNLLYDAYATLQMVVPGVPGTCLQVYGFLPFSHAFSLQANIMCMLYAGGTICLGSGPGSFMKEINRMQPSYMIAVPQIVKGILGYLRVRHVEKAEAFPIMICGGAMLEEKLIVQMKEKGITVIQGYGTTECAPIIAVNPPYNNRTAASGKLLEGIELRIYEDEILVKGENVFGGYINDTAATEQVFIDGYYRTGDKGWIDEDQYLYVNGRLKDTIVLATGENISPSALEEKLMDLPTIKDAFVYEKKTGNVGCISAVVYPALSREDVLPDVQRLNQELEDYERIRLIEFAEAPLARTELGKIRRIQNYIIIGKEQVK